MNKTIKIFYLLVLVLGISACSKVDMPECGDDSIELNFQQMAWTDSNYNIKPLPIDKKPMKHMEFWELPSDTPHSRRCNIMLVFEDGDFYNSKYYIVQQPDKKFSAIYETDL